MKVINLFEQGSLGYALSYIFNNPFFDVTVAFYCQLPIADCRFNQLTMGFLQIGNWQSAIGNINNRFGAANES